MKSRSSILKTAATGMAIACLCVGAGNVCHAQNQPLSPDLQEVVKLSQARMPDDVIKNYISSTGKAYHLNADDIIYLNSQGVSSGVIGTLQATSPAAPSPAQVMTPPPAPQPPPQPAPSANSYPQPPPDAGYASADVQATPPPPAEVNFQYFHDQLSPFGTWVNVGGATYWRPDEAMAVNPDWRPYYDMGQWAETDNGLYWQSDYTWGDIPFHYGRWVFQPGIGWLWAPDYTWGPAWVFWRHDEADACIGWAPLPVGAVFLNGGFFFHGAAVGLDFDFGLGESCFTFVGYDHFHEGFFRMRGREWAYHVDRARLHNFYGHSVIRNDFRRDDHGRFVNNGIGRDRVEHLTHVEHANFEERGPVGDRNKLALSHTDLAHKGTGGPVEQGHGQPNIEQGHGQPNNTAAEHTFKPAGGENATIHDNNNVSHDNNFHGQSVGNEHSSGIPASKVYRPPTTGNGGGGNASQSSHGQSQPQGGNNKKKQ